MHITWLADKKVTLVLPDLRKRSSTLRGHPLCSDAAAEANGAEVEAGKVFGQLLCDGGEARR